MSFLYPHPRQTQLMYTHTFFAHFLLAFFFIYTESYEMHPHNFSCVRVVNSKVFG